MRFIKKVYFFSTLIKMFDLIKDLFTRLFEYKFDLIKVKIKCFRLI